MWFDRYSAGESLSEKHALLWTTLAPDAHRLIFELLSNSWQIMVQCPGVQAKGNTLQPEEAPALIAGHDAQARPGGLKGHARGIYARATPFHQGTSSPLGIASRTVLTYGVRKDSQ